MHDVAADVGVDACRDIHEQHERQRLVLARDERLDGAGAAINRDVEVVARQPGNELAVRRLDRDVQELSPERGA